MNQSKVWILIHLLLCQRLSELNVNIILVIKWVLKTLLVFLLESLPSFLRFQYIVSMIDCICRWVPRCLFTTLISCCIIQLQAFHLWINLWFSLLLIPLLFCLTLRTEIIEWVVLFTLLAFLTLIECWISVMILPAYLLFWLSKCCIIRNLDLCKLVQFLKIYSQGIISDLIILLLVNCYRFIWLFPLLFLVLFAHYWALDLCYLICCLA